MPRMRIGPGSADIAVHLKTGLGRSDDLTTCSDLDMVRASSHGRSVHGDGTPYAEGRADWSPSISSYDATGTSVAAACDRFGSSVTKASA